MKGQSDVQITHLLIQMQKADREYLSPIEVLMRNLQSVSVKRSILEFGVVLHALLSPLKGPQLKDVSLIAV